MLIDVSENGWKWVKIWFTPNQFSIWYPNQFLGLFSATFFWNASRTLAVMNIELTA